MAGQVVRVVTTGGGGWGDPLAREPDLVRRDVIEGKVSPTAAREDYGVVFTAAAEQCLLDLAATQRLRASLRRDRRPLAMIDRGPGYEAMATGKA